MRKSIVLVPAFCIALAACGEANGEETVAEAEVPAEPGIVGAPAKLPEEEEAVEPASAPATTASRTSPERAVMVGRDGPDFDACGGYGEVTGLNPNGDNYLSVRSLPRVDSDELDRLGPDTGVIMCESVRGFEGIVYPGEGQDISDCATSSPGDGPRPYSGPCRSGWVSQTYITLIAG